MNKNHVICPIKHWVNESIFTFIMQPPAPGEAMQMASSWIVVELEIGEVNAYFGGRELRHCNLVTMVSMVLCLLT